MAYSKVDTKNLNRLILNVNATEKQLLEIGQTIILPRLLNCWKNGKGGDGNPMKPLSDEYRKWKEKRFGRNKPDMMITGSLTRSMQARKKSDGVVVVTSDLATHTVPKSFKSNFGSNSKKVSGVTMPKTNLDILRENAHMRGNLMDVSDDMRKATSKYIKKYILEGVQTA